MFNELSRDDVGFGFIMPHARLLRQQNQKPSSALG